MRLKMNMINGGIYARMFFFMLFTLLFMKKKINKSKKKSIFLAILLVRFMRKRKVIGIIRLLL